MVFFAGNVVAIQQLKQIVKFGNMPNLILVVSERNLCTNILLNFARISCRVLPELVKLRALFAWLVKCSATQ